MSSSKFFIHPVTTKKSYRTAKLIGIAFSLITIATLSPQAQAKPATGAPADIAGQAHVLYVDDFEKGTSEIQHFIEDEKTRKLHRLRFKKGDPKGLKSGQKIRVKGRFNKEEVEVEESTAPLSQDGQASGSSAGETAQTGTVRRAVVLMVDLSDAFASSRYTKAQIHGQMYGNATNVADMYKTASHGKLNFDPDANRDLSSDIFGPFKIDAPAATCDPYGWAYKVEAAAVAAGVNLALYEHRVFVLPRYNEIGCTWAGLANVGCGLSDQHKSGYCRAWIAEGESGMVYGHEIGHNLGMAHAATDHGNDGVIDSEYGDNSDPMGLSRSWRVFNAPHAHQMGWFDGTANTIVDITASVTTAVYPMERAGSLFDGPRSFRIGKKDSSEFYYVSFRKAVGGYTGLDTNYKDRINIHRYRGSGYNNTVFIKALADGASFVDTANGITITQTGLLPDGSMGMSVSFECTRTAPSVTMQPATVAMQPGQSASLRVTVVNNDGPSCPATDFAVTTIEKALLNVMTGTLAPGASWSTSFNVAGNLFAVNSKNTLTVQANGGTGRVTQSKATVIVDGIAPSAPVITGASLGRKDSVSLSWNGSQDNTNGSGMDYYAVFRNGELRGATTSTTYNDGGASSGDVYVVTAVDLAGNSASSAGVAVTGTTSTKTGNPKGRR